MLFSLLLFNKTYLFAEDYEPRGAYRTEDQNIKLPSLEFTGKLLIVAIVLIGLGWIISKASEKPNGGGGSSFGGILIIGGIICVIPCLAWIQAIGTSIYIIVIVLGIIFFILSSFWDKLKGK